jgi:hypothetical protein
MQLTQEEIQFIKDMYANHVVITGIEKVENKVSAELAKIAAKYQPKLDEAEADGDTEKRRLIIEVMTSEARKAEDKIRSEYDAN